MKAYFKNQKGDFTLYRGDCNVIIPELEEKFDLVFADPPYFLSSNGNTINSGKIVSVNKGKWDESINYNKIYNFNLSWLKISKEILEKDGTIWISGTRHNIFTIIQALDELNFKILNVITWEKLNPPPNFNTKIFKQSTEYIVFARPFEKYTHKFNVDILKKINNGKRFTDVWKLPSINRWEKEFGKHPTQKPLNLLVRIILAATNEDDLILDPFCGSSTTGIAANLLRRSYIGIDTEKKYLEISKKRRNDLEDKGKVSKYEEKLSELKKLYDMNLF